MFNNSNNKKQTQKGAIIGSKQGNESKYGRVGTPLYLSPEVVREQAYDYKIDTWAFGCCLYHLAALEPPFLGDNI